MTPPTEPPPAEFDEFADRYDAPPTTHTFNRPGAPAERVDDPAESVLATAPVRPSNLTHVVYGGLPVKDGLYPDEPDLMFGSAVL